METSTLTQPTIRSSVPKHPVHGHQELTLREIKVSKEIPALMVQMEMMVQMERLS